MFSSKMAHVGTLLDDLAQKDKNSAKVFKQSLTSIDPVHVRNNLAENLKIRLDDQIEPKLNGKNRYYVIKSKTMIFRHGPVK